MTAPGCQAPLPPVSCPTCKVLPGKRCRVKATGREYSASMAHAARRAAYRKLCLRLGVKLIVDRIDAIYLAGTERPA